MITYKLFHEALESIKHHRELTNDFCDVLNKMTSERYDCDAFVYDEYEHLVVKLLENGLNLPPNCETLAYFIYDLDFGVDYQKGCFQDQDDQDIDISDDKKLYNYLLTIIPKK